MPERPEKSDKELLDEFEAAIAASEQEERTLEALLEDMEERFGIRDELTSRRLEKMKEQTAELRRQLEQFRAQLPKEDQDAE